MRLILNSDVRNKKIAGANDFLEKIGTSMRLIYAFYALVLAVLLRFWITHAENVLLEIVWGVSGFLLITAVEYCVHRFLFHHKNPKFFLRKIHLRHHINQDNSAHGVVPLPLSLALIFVVSLPFFFLLQSHVTYVALLFAMIIGYLVHETTHYLNHQAEPRTAWGRYFRSYHQFHHRTDLRYNYGFMVPFWDILFSTYRIKNGDTHDE